MHGLGEEFNPHEDIKGIFTIKQHINEKMICFFILAMAI
jgi:hypothetical protein